jgi:hypothetical protein
MKNLYLKVFIITLIIIPLAACAKTFPHNGTQVKMLKPVVAGKLASSYTVVRKTTGQCSASLANPRPDTRRCFGTADNGVYDPCFKMNSRELICLNAPWDKKATLMRTVKPLTKRKNILDPNTQMPWAVTLGYGAKCVFLTGVTKEFNDDRINYVCNDRTRLFGDFDRTKAFWRISSANQNVYEVSSVQTAWY